MRLRTTGATPAGVGEGLEDRQQLFRGGALTLVGTISYALLTFLLAVVLTRGLHASGAGVFFVVTALFTVVLWIALFGSEAGTVRAMARNQALGRGGDFVRTILVAAIPVGVAAAGLAVALFVFAAQIADPLIRGDDGDTAATYLRVLAPFLPLAAVSTVVLAATRGLGTMAPFVVIEHLGRAALRPLLIALAIATGFGAAAVALAWALPLALGLGVACAWLLVILRRTERAGTSAPSATTREIAGAFWSFSAPRGLASIFQITILWLDTILLAALSSARDAGIYTAAARYVTVAAFALQAITLVFEPQLSVLLARGQSDRAQRLYQTATMWLMIICWPIYLTLALFASLFLSIFGSEFIEGEAALIILAGAMLFHVATGPVTSVLLMAGKSSWNLANTVAALTTNVILNLLLIPRYGMTGAAIAWTASYVVNNVLPLIQIRLLLKLHPVSPGLGLVAAAALFCYGGIGIAIRALVGPSAAGLFLFVALSTASYSVLLWSFRQKLQLPSIADTIGSIGGTLSRIRPVLARRA